MDDIIGSGRSDSTRQVTMSTTYQNRGYNQQRGINWKVAKVTRKTETCRDIKCETRRTDRKL